jgi:hypothetical protein
MLKHEACRIGQHGFPDVVTRLEIVRRFICSTIPDVRDGSTPAGRRARPERLTLTAKKPLRHDNSYSRAGGPETARKLPVQA